jgi:hypothetical protein
MLAFGELYSSFARYHIANRADGFPPMLFILSTTRAQKARNRHKAEALIAEHGEQTIDFVREQIAATAWQIRDHDHWMRIEKHVMALLKRK